ncbi:Glutamyl endopeptidase [Colletotrichum trifolii]|uniref:Serine protease n=1 Tax=Colletotrichum trifolii TaxID=5466 RepID=A0A4R8QXY1_COLTR|nr:Glutamyl endopeptidase [Colletotrichum trifolii]
MVHFTALTAFAALSLSSAVLGAPTTQDAGIPDPSSVKTPMLGFDPAVVEASKKGRLPYVAPPQILNLDVASLEEGNATEFAPSSHGAEQQKRGVIGNDDRVLWTNKDYPYRAMGRIVQSNGVVCSGALIGSRHVATARHCIPHAGVSARFQPAYDNGEPYGGYDVTLVVHAAYGQEGWCANTYDWAIFVLGDKAGTANGWLGLKIVNPDTQLNRAMFFNYGYPGDKGANRPYRQEGITATAATYCDRGSPVITDTDSAGGQSGGPVWINENGERYLYAIHVGSGADFSVAAGGTSFLNAYGNLLKDYPN